eukprot:scaffold113437_cov50-Cyclotella_meneghiniana.AAC.3
MSLLSSECSRKSQAHASRQLTPHSHDSSSPPHHTHDHHRRLSAPIATPRSRLDSLSSSRTTLLVSSLSLSVVALGRRSRSSLSVVASPSVDVPAG